MAETPKFVARRSHDRTAQILAFIAATAERAGAETRYGRPAPVDGWPANPERACLSRGTIHGAVSDWGFDAKPTKALESIATSSASGF